MAFDINKHMDSTFHEDEGIDNKIKALLLWYEYQIHIKELDIEQRGVILDNIISMAIKNEWYEVADFFNKKKK